MALENNLDLGWENLDKIDSTPGLPSLGFATFSRSEESSQNKAFHEDLH